jgi:hypothetical protein
MLAVAVALMVFAHLDLRISRLGSLKLYLHSLGRSDLSWFRASDLVTGRSDDFSPISSAVPEINGEAEEISDGGEEKSEHKEEKTTCRHDENNDCCSENDHVVEEGLRERLEQNQEHGERRDGDHERSEPEPDWLHGRFLPTASKVA